MSEVIEEECLFEESYVSFHKLKQALENEDNFMLHQSNLPGEPPTKLKILANQYIDQHHHLALTLLIDKQAIKFRGELYRNYEKLIINSGEIRKLLNRAALSRAIVGAAKITVNESGEISLLYTTIINNLIAKKVQGKNISSAILLLEKYYADILAKFKKQVTSIILMCNSSPSSLPSLSPQVRESIKLTKYLVEMSNLGLPPNDHDDQQIIDNIGNMNGFNAYKSACLYDLTMNPKQNSRKIEDFVQNCLQSYSQETLQLDPLTKNQNGQNCEKVLTEIHVVDYPNTKWTNFKKGGFGCLYISTIKYCYVGLDKLKSQLTSHNKVQTSNMILKVDDKKNIGKMFIEREIVKQIKNQHCNYLPKYYFCEEIVFKYALMIEYLPMKSIADYMADFGKHLSIVTKLKICLEICYGLNFLHRNDIIHRDLKTTNILVDRNLTPKICDFGESYHPEVFQKAIQKKIRVKPGVSIPYTPFEYFNQSYEALIFPSYDIFSLGVIIFEILFERIIFTGSVHEKVIKLIKEEGYNSQNRSSFCQKYERFLLSKLVLAPQFIQNYGPKEVLNPILTIIHKCISLQPEKRPNLHWIIAILKETYSNLIQFYYPQ